MSIYSQLAGAGGGGGSSVTINTPSGSATSSDGNFTFTEDGTTTISASGDTVNFSSTGTGSLNSNGYFRVDGGSISDVTGDGTLYQIILGNTMYQNGSDITQDGSGLYTINASGVYLFSWSLCVNNLSLEHTSLEGQFFAGNFGADNGGPFVVDNPGIHFNANEGNSLVYFSSFCMQCTAGQTFFLTVQVDGSTKTVGLQAGWPGGSFNDGNYLSYARIV